MSATDILKEAGQSASGAISKAVIEISDERNVVQMIEVSASRARRKVKMDTGLSTEAITAAVQDINSNAAKKIENLTKSLPSWLGDKKRFEVKFNPSQISFQVYAGNKVYKNDLAQSNADENGSVSITYQDMAPRIQMNVQLIFDDYERTQAFMLEKASDPSAIVRTAIDGAVSAKQHKTYSVRPQVEGFIGALRNNYTRKITFYWGNMSYSGVLTDVSAQYTMFSTDGNPIRANVNLGILCTDESISDNYMGQWQESFKKVFGNDDTTDLGSKLQNVGNILNINL